MQTCLPLGLNVTNRSLFADHFFKHRLPELDEWKAASGIDEAFKEIRSLYSEKAARFTNRTNEQQTERDLIRPILDILWREKKPGDCYEVQATISALDQRRQPDYAFFYSAADRDAASTRQGTSEFWRDVPVLGDAKAWSASLDRQTGEENPSAQIANYLYRSGVRWGILTNGRLWRLYEREKSRAGGIFFQIDLENILRGNDRDGFKYFLLFFRRESFLTGPSGTTFLDKVFQGSIDYAAEVGDRLKESVYDALRLLINGLFEHGANRLNRADPTAIKRVHENALIVLYRLLFLLYAEDRNLLPRREEPYASCSLYHIQTEINGQLRDGKSCLPTSTRFWSHLANLFSLIDNGYAQARIPAYNGGLFSPERFPHIAHTPQPGVSRWDIGDQRLAEVIDMLAYQRERWDEPGEKDIDYNTLAVQHLGSIYEGLLELQPRVASEPMIETLDEGKAVFKPAAEVSKPRSIRNQNARYIAANEIYLVTNRGERKATGSYYTPKYIVDYIVQHTLGPLVDEAASQVAKLRPEVGKKIAKLERTRREWVKEAKNGNHAEVEQHIAKLTTLIEEQKRRLLEPYLSLKILDPTMGSGHFLVDAADFLSLAMATDPNVAPPDESVSGEDTQAFYKRLVVERCLYGVDLNQLAVELAKLSLWLHTVSKDKALSFLDHHLRCGNSLIGVRIEDDLCTPPPEFNVRGRVKKRDTHQLVLGFTETLTATHLQYLLDTFQQIVETPTGDAETERLKDKLYRDMDAVRDKFRAVANCWLAPYFGVGVTADQYQKAVTGLREPSAFEPLKSEPWFKEAQMVAREGKHFFHWELEFPEVFFDAQGFKPKEQRGFDAVIGNPPYDVISEKEQQREVENEKQLFDYTPIFSSAVGSKLNLYRLFVALAGDLLRATGYNGFIVPMALLADAQSKPLREHVLSHYRLRLVEAFPQKDDARDRVFLDAKLSTCLYVLQKSSPASFVVRVHPGRQILEKSLPVTIHPPDLNEFDPGNLSIPCYPNLTNADFALALKVVQLCGDAKLSRWAPSQQGEVNLTTHKQFLSNEPIGPVVLRGANVGRYLFNTQPKQGEPVYLRVKEFLQHQGRDTKAFHYQFIRIGYQRGAAIDNWRRIIATIIEPGNFCSDTINYITNPKDINLFTILALLNSSLWEWRFRLTSTNNHVNSYEIDGMPMPPVVFTRPSVECERLLEQGKLFYSKYLINGDADRMLDIVGEGLGPRPERGKVVHDLLAFLAEKMITLNRQKQEEVKGFLTWLERDIGAPLDELGNKTKLQLYYEDSFEALLDVLRANRRKLSVSPDTRSVQETIEREFSASVAKIIPLKTDVAATDELINRVVYRLYGLTDDDIKIVEGGE